MSIAAWIVAYVLLGLLLIITLVYVGVLVMRAYTIRKENRRKTSNYGFILSPPPSETSGVDTPPSPKRLEASVRPPSEAPFSGELACKSRRSSSAARSEEERLLSQVTGEPKEGVGDMREIRIQPLLIRRSIDFPSPLSPSSPRTPNTPGFFEDLGSLDPSLYTMVAEEDEEPPTPGAPDGRSSPYNLGQAHFIVKFDQHRSVLSVRLVKALNLSPMEKEWSKPCNPYVIVQLLPDYRHQLQSTVHRKTTNPRFDETFEFELSYKELQLQTLWLTFLSFDSSSRHEVIGQVVLPLADLDLANENVFRTDIRPSLKKQVSLGEMMVSLGYLKSAERLTVVVIKARNLPSVNIKGTDSYVKVYLLVAGKRAKKKKTSVRKGTLNPVFNEAVSFDIAMDALNSVDLLLSVMHENEIIGCVPIGAHSTGKELDHWREVRTANKPVAHWHSLQDPKKFY